MSQPLFLLVVVIFVLVFPLLGGEQDIGWGFVGLGIIAFLGLPIAFGVSAIALVLTKNPRQYTLVQHTLLILLGLLLIGALIVERQNQISVQQQTAQSNQEFMADQEAVLQAKTFTDCQPLTSELDAWTKCTVRTVTTTSAAAECKTFVESNPARWFTTKDFYNYALAHCQVIAGQKIQSTEPCAALQNSHDDSDYFFDVCVRFVQNQTLVANLFPAPNR